MAAREARLRVPVALAAAGPERARLEQEQERRAAELPGSAPEGQPGEPGALALRPARVPEREVPVPVPVPVPEREQEQEQEQEQEALVP